MKNQNVRKISLGVFTALALSTNSFANDTSDIELLKQEIKELREITKTLLSQKGEIQEIKETQQTLIDETSDLKTGFNYTTVDTEKSHSGLSSAASKVYYSKSPLSIGGYGEMYYAHTSVDGADNSSVVDVYRFVPYIGYKFSDNIILNVELEFEYGGVTPTAGGEVIVEFMYLDFLLNNNANIRVGNFLVPMGLINERHEPTLFTTVQRPNTSKNLIPSTWHESGVMAYGEITDGLSYKLAGITGLTPDNSGDKWIRNGRGGSFKNNDPKLAVVGRIDYTGVNGLLLGASVYNDSDLTMIDTHLDYNLDAFRVYGVYSQTNRSGAINGQVEEAKGGFLNISYDLLSFTNSNDRLPIFVQYESVAAQDKLAGGSSVESIDTTTIGINYFPHEQVVLKVDYAMQEQNGAADKGIASLSMGFIF